MCPRQLPRARVSGPGTVTPRLRPALSRRPARGPGNALACSGRNTGPQTPSCRVSLVSSRRDNVSNFPCLRSRCLCRAVMCGFEETLCVGLMFPRSSALLERVTQTRALRRRGRQCVR